MAKTPNESKPGKPDPKASAKASPSAEEAGAAVPSAKAKPKITAVEARKKLKGGKKDPAETAAGGEAGGDGAGSGERAKKKPANLNLPKDFSKKIGLKEGDESVEEAEASDKPKANPNIAIHTTNRDKTETRKVYRLLATFVVGSLLIVGVVLFLQLRDPEGSRNSQVVALEMGHYRQALQSLDRSKLKPGPDGKLKVDTILQVLSDQLDAKVRAAATDKDAVKTMMANPELYSLYLASKFQDPFGQAIRVTLVNGKITIRSSGPDKVDDTGNDSASAKGDDIVVSE